MRLSPPQVHAAVHNSGERKYIANLDLIRDANTVFRADAEEASRNWPEAKIISLENSGSISGTVKLIRVEIDKVVRGK